MARVWRYAVHDAPRVKSLSASLGVPALVAQVLLARGVESAEDAREFLSARLTDLHDPSLLPGIDEAADRVVSAIGDGRQITIYGDYDVDGTSSIALMRAAIELAGGSASFHVPHRVQDGYGMRVEVVEQAARENVRLIISVDTGIRENAVVERATELGIDSIITDHHLPVSYTHLTLPTSDLV